MNMTAKPRVRLMLAAAGLVGLAIGGAVLVSTKNPSTVEVKQLGSTAPITPSAKEAAEQQQHEAREKAAQGPRAPKGQYQNVGSCPEPETQPLIQAAAQAVPGIRMTPVSETRVVFGRFVYLVWSGLNTADDAAANQGTIVVVETARDTCADPNATSYRTQSDMAEPHGAITLTSVDGALLSFRTDDGTTGNFNLATMQYSK